MLKKTAGLLLTLLIILAVTLSACKSAPTTSTTTVVTGTTTTAPTTTKPATTPATTTPSANQPQYGGTLTTTLGNRTAYMDPVVSSVGGWNSAVTYEKLVSADWSKGPEGTNEFSFAIPYVPQSYRTGVIAESWDIPDLNTVIFHIRQGIHFQNKPPANGAEVNANDVVYSYRRGQQDTRFTSYEFAKWDDTAGLATERARAKALGKTDAEIDAWIAELKSINYPFYAPTYMVATDKWIVKYRALIASNQMLDTGDWLFVESTLDANYDMNDWHNACGTGAFIVSDVVADSSITWVANPNYWMKDPVHKGNKLPYVDKKVGLWITDQSIQLAGLRTHKIDILGVSSDQVDLLHKNNPELLSKKIAPSNTNLIFMRTDIAPFNNVKVRQALCMGVNRDSIINDYYKGNAVADNWPAQIGSEGYTPIAQMPPDVKQLYEYHPDLAKKLLADAGYPNGFKTEIIVYVWAPIDELVTLVAEQLKTINVDATVRVLEATTHTSLLYNFTYPQMIFTYWGNTSPSATMGWAHGGVTASIYSFSHAVDPEAVTAYSTWAGMSDPIARSAFLKKEYLREDLLAWEIPVPTEVGSVFWQPYVKGYQGEVGMGLTSEMGSTEGHKFYWIDEALKQQITGSK
jgi:peptide/nickel transport system substrate-binding protein